MAYKLIDHEWCAELDSYRQSFIVDTDADIANLPKCCPGSTALVADKGGAIYMVNASGEWKEQ